jgi:hypothetical protein
MADYAWIIDHDYLEDADSKYDARGVTGPSDAPDALLELLGAPRGPRNHLGVVAANVLRFRILDDDGELYYTGRQAFIDPDTADEDAEFGPLNDFGMPNAGATELQQWVDGKWQTL